MSYRRLDGSYFIWWDGAVVWYISTVLGVIGAGAWSLANPTIEGTYTGFGTSSGNAIVTEI
ncbi:hypothetical protein ES703_110172 [subsurface metagenome]